MKVLRHCENSREGRVERETGRRKTGERSRRKKNFGRELGKGLSNENFWKQRRACVAAEIRDGSFPSHQKFSHLTESSWEGGSLFKKVGI